MGIVCTINYSPHIAEAIIIHEVATIYILSGNQKGYNLSLLAYWPWFTPFSGFAYECIVTIKETLPHDSGMFIESCQS